jgi:sugar phosphate isomerase/epimerase
MNPEPAEAEVHYLAHDLEECHYYFERLKSPALGWSFTVNHAHILPIGIDRFMDGMDIGRCGEVRLADCRGTIEEHLLPGEGTIDFPAVFARIEAAGYKGHYTMAFGSLSDMLAGRATLAALAEQGLKAR